MNREQLRHAISAASEVSGDHELYVFGSQAIPPEKRDICERWLTATWRNLEMKRGSADG